MQKIHEFRSKFIFNKNSKEHKSKFKYKNTCPDFLAFSCPFLSTKHNVEDKFFIPHNFISLATRTTSTLSWILGKSLLKPKRAHIYTKKYQSPWFKLIAHHLFFWLMILGVIVWRSKKYVQ